MELFSQVFKRLCLAFAGGLDLPHAWMLALASIENTLETKEWAVSDLMIVFCAGFVYMQSTRPLTVIAMYTYIASETRDCRALSAHIHGKPNRALRQSQ